MNRKAVIFGLKGLVLKEKEKKFIKKIKPWGIILFSRNIRNISQLKKLVDEIKKTINDKNYPILIDQEGGKVSRLDNIIDFSIFSQNLFGNLYKKNKKISYNKYHIYIMIFRYKFPIPRFIIIFFYIFYCDIRII